jgi:FkbM family methyltransferase
VQHSIKSYIKFLFFRIKKGVGLSLSDDGIQFLRVFPWVSADGDNTHRLNYSLNEDSIVFDLGGYHGDWAELISKRYNSNIYIFEPFPAFAEIIRKKFISNPKIKVFEFGLSRKNETISLSNDENKSSHYTNTSKLKITAFLKSYSEFISENNIEHIDLMKINIEGGEYDLLEGIIDQNLTNRIKNLQIQFHDFIVENAHLRMTNIQENLKKTHFQTYSYKFVWENWQLKTNNEYS